MNSKMVLFCLVGLICLQLSHQASEICSLPPVAGDCKGLFYRFYYKPATKTCEQFVYGGCRGNENNFLTVEECTAACGQ
ncbi:unnamed protein product [Lymnaea stagnalis]|uniref:BPTI/Kunitz inhibitor domain-containing protein n=1 Tax=Lymnaea stagnalis TaxID=6523 RepID=A0AAV2HHR6_LYMST